MLDAYIFSLMKNMKNMKLENTVGALSLAIADIIHQSTQQEAPETGPAAAALALLGHEPGMSIERLRRSLGMSHPGTVRLVDRLVAEGVVERKQVETDRRAVALYLTPAGSVSCASVLAARQERVSQILEVLDPAEREILERITEKLLSNMVKDLDHAYSMCRLCDAAACMNCPVADALGESC